MHNAHNAIAIAYNAIASAHKCSQQKIPAHNAIAIAQNQKKEG